MSDQDPKADLHHYLRGARSAVLWKLEGLGEYELRRPLTSTGTNLLGLVKHLSGVELLYFGVAFGRVPTSVPAWFGENMEPNADLWATEAEVTSEIVATYGDSCALADRTIEELSLDHVGFAPWLPDPEVTLQRILVHVLAETERHAGHADIVRELIDGAVGRQPDNPQLTPGADRGAARTAGGWGDLRDRIEHAAATVATATPEARDHRESQGNS